MTEMEKLMGKLTPQQKAAIEIVKLSLDCFNGKDGYGLFSGVTRYNVLTSRLEIAAVQSNSIPKFWAVLLRKMCWTVPPKSYDSRIARIMTGEDDAGTLIIIATETASIVTIARMLHDADKANRHHPLSQDDEEFFSDAGKIEGLI